MPAIPTAEEAAAAAASAQAAFNRSATEVFTLFAVAFSVTVLRTYARVRSHGWARFRMDDAWVWIAMLFHGAQAGLAYSIGHAAHGLANSNMTDEERASLDPSGEEYSQRVLGAKIQVAGWSTYSCLIWSYKLSMLFFYIRLTEGLMNRYRKRIYTGFALVLASFLAAILTLFLGCRPFTSYWQINPNPGTTCQAGVSLNIVWSSFAANISTDLYLIWIPLPMLWRSSLPMSKKMAATVVLGAGIFVLACATLKSVFVISDPEHGGANAAAWGTREAFVANITTNLPMIFPLLKSWFRPLYNHVTTPKSGQEPEPTRIPTIGGGGRHSGSRRKKPPPTVNPITTNLTFSESEERIVDDIKMQNLNTLATDTDHTLEPTDGQIVVSRKIEIVHEDRQSLASQSFASQSHTQSQSSHVAEENW